MELPELKKLIALLKKEGVTHFNTPAMELRIPLQSDAPRSVQSAQSDEGIEENGDASGQLDEEDEELTEMDKIRRLYAEQANGHRRRPT